MYQVYKITNKINNKCYIGSSEQVQKRWLQHKQASINENDHHYYYPLMCAFRKYGIDNFTFEIIETCQDKETMLAREHEWIMRMNSVAPNGYNQTTNTSTPMKTSEVVKKMMNTKRNLYGKKVAETTKDNVIIQIYSSIIECAERTGCDRFKISAVCSGHRISTGGKYFRFLDKNNNIIVPEKKVNQTISNKITKNSKEVIKIKNGKVIETYPSIAIAAQKNNCDASGISKVCNGKRNSCGGFEWKYKTQM